MKVFVTGGAGQVGSTVIDMLAKRGDDVLAIDNFTTGRRDNLAPDAKVKLIEDTIVDGAVIDRLFEDFKPDVVVHTAASYKDPEDWGTDALVNAAGTANIAKACKIHKVGRLIYFQTALCYGTKPTQSADHARSFDQSGEFELRYLQDRRRTLCAISPAPTG